MFELQNYLSWEMKSKAINARSRASNISGSAETSRAAVGRGKTGSAERPKGKDVRWELRAEVYISGAFMYIYGGREIEKDTGRAMPSARVPAIKIRNRWFNIKFHSQR